MTGAPHERRGRLLKDRPGLIKALGAHGAAHGFTASDLTRLSDFRLAKLGRHLLIAERCKREIAKLLDRPPKRQAEADRLFG